MGKEVKDFAVETKGYCFLCLKRNFSRPLSQFVKLVSLSQNESDKDTKDFPFQSLQCLSRYLELDMGKVFTDNESGHVETSLLTKVRNSKLKVQLCEECDSLNLKFMELFRKLEKVRMEIVTIVGDISTRIEQSKKVQVMVESIDVEPFNKGKFEIAETLRKETEQACYLKVKAMPPLVRIQNLTIQDVKKEARKLKISERKGSKILRKDWRPSSTSNNCMDENSDQEIELGAVKVEAQIPISTRNEEQSEDSNDFEDLQDDPLDSDNSVSGIQDFHLSSRSVEMGKGVGVSNPKPGAHRCGICKKGFLNKNGLRRHHRRIHIHAEQFKCPRCEKKFFTRQACNRHEQRIHIGIQFVCKKCSKSFKWKSNYYLHLRETKCGVGESNVKPLDKKYICPICKKEFYAPVRFKSHMDSVHLKLRAHICSRCGKGFSNKSYLREHANRIHSNLQEFDCDLCKRVFKIKRDLSRHRLKVHKVK